MSDRSPRVRPRRESLPFDDEVEQDDAPTHALDLSDELRALRAIERAARAEPLPTGYEGGEEDPTSIIPSPHELQQLSRARRAETLDGLGDATIVGTPSMLAEPGQPESPEQVLRMLRAQGVFEQGAAPTKPATWGAQLAVERTRQLHHEVAGGRLGLRGARGGRRLLRVPGVVRPAPGRPRRSSASARRLVRGQHASLAAAESS